MEIARRGFVLILASPSGAGKTTLSRMLIEADHDIRLWVSATTRPKRPSEIDGVHYRFISPQDFARLRDSEVLLEWAEVHGYCYGTPSNSVNDNKSFNEYLASGIDVLLDIDWQGTVQVQEKLPDDVVSVLVLPPSMSELERRLRIRAEDNDGVIKNRLDNARSDVNQWRLFDYIVVNNKLVGTCSTLLSILRAERTRQRRVIGLENFIFNLITG